VALENMLRLRAALNRMQGMAVSADKTSIDQRCYGAQFATTAAGRTQPIT